MTKPVPTGADPEVSFTEADLARAELIRHLQSDLEVNDAGAAASNPLIRSPNQPLSSTWPVPMRPCAR
jgi:hypothetical protein